MGVRFGELIQHRWIRVFANFDATYIMLDPGHVRRLRLARASAVLRTQSQFSMSRDMTYQIEVLRNGLIKIEA